MVAGPRGGGQRRKGSAGRVAPEGQRRMGSAGRAAPDGQRRKGSAQILNFG